TSPPMSPAAKRGPPTSGLSTLNWRFSPPHRAADRGPLFSRSTEQTRLAQRAHRLQTDRSPMGILDVLRQLRQAQHLEKQRDPRAVERPAREGLVAVDDPARQVGGDHVGIDELLMQLAEAGIAEIIDAIEA